MKKVLIVLSVVLFTLSTQAQDFAGLYKKMSPSVVTIMVKESNVQADMASNSLKKVRT